MVERIKDVISWLKNERIILSQAEFSEKIGVNPSQMSEMISGKRAISERTINKIILAFPELNPVRLITGEGEMLKPGGTLKQNIHNSGTISAQNGVIGQVHGDFHNNGSKDQVIEEQKSEISKMFEAIILAVGGFQKASERHDDYVVRQDDYIKRQDEYIARIINNSYQRNKENMERMDSLIIEMKEDRQKSREQLDRLLNMLERKIGL